MRKPKPALFKVGRYRLGWRWVELWVDNSRDGGTAIFVPDKVEITKITIGISKAWGDSIGTFLHEANEIAYCDMNSSWHRRTDFSNDTDRALFVLTHADFNEATNRVGWFLSKAMPAFSAAYRRHHIKPS